MKELNELQRKIVISEENKIIVDCAAASGKTRCLIERIRYLLKQHPTNHIVAITFTNAAAEEIKNRLDYIPTNCFIGTVHSYCNYLLLSNGINTNKIIQEENFDELFNLIETIDKLDINVDYLLLDEGQDSTKEEFNFLLNIVKPKNWIIFCDRRQSIYSFRFAFPEYITFLMKQPDVVIYPLNYNYRCKENILNFAKGIIDRLGFNFYDNSIAINPNGHVYKIEFTPENIIKAINKNKEYDYKDWFVLVRTNEQLQYIYNELTKANIPCDTFKRAELDNSSLQKKMNENTVKILTIHSAKGLENKNVIVGSFPLKNAEEIRVAYVAATRAIDNLYWFQPKSKRKKKNTIKIQNWE